jgi:nitrogen fixation/metabolism regulation signal transduction histidine kinase
LATYKRKQFWIDSPLQLQMLGFVLLLVIVSIGLVSYSAMHGLEEAAAAESRKFFFSLDWVRNAIRAPMILASGLSILAAGLATLIWSHRFAGPLRVLSAAMGRMKDGDFTVAPRVRKTDTHQELVAEYAAMQDDLREKLTAERRKAHAAAKKLEHLAEKHADLNDIAAEVKSLGDGFKL